MILNETIFKAIFLMSKSLNSQPIACDFFKDPGLLDYCILQSIEGIVSSNAEKSYHEGLLDENGYKKWDNVRNNILYQNLKYEIERNNLFEKFTEKQIYFMPLKGIILNELYPYPGMRPCGDNDIFFDVSKVRDMDQIMKNCKFIRIEEGNSYHYIYHKEPFFSFEMHIALMKSGMEVSRKRALAIKNFYMDIKERLIPDKNNPFSLSFSLEDFYIFHLTHAQSHFNTSGMGLKFLADTYILLKTYREAYNWDYINDVLEKFDMCGFENMLRSLSTALFSPHSDSFDEYEKRIAHYLTENESTALKYISSNSVFNNHDEALAIQLSLIHQGKNSFDELKFIENKFPVSVKIKYLLLYFAQMTDEINISLNSTKKSRLLLLPVLIKKTIFKITHHSKAVKSIVK